MRKKFGKLKITAGVFILLLIFLFLLPFVLPQATYKNWFVSQVESTLPVKISVTSFRLLFLPLPSLRLSGVRIFSTLAPFENLLMAEIETLSVSVPLKQLWHRRVEASLKIEAPALYWRVTQKGVSNFHSLFAPKASTNNGSWQFQIASFALADGVLRLLPEVGKKYEIQNVDFSLKDLNLTDKSTTPFSLSLGLLGGSQNLKLSGEVKRNGEQWVGDNLKLKLGELNAVLKGTFD
ncbi:MAG: AsmA family protein, partial [Deltaproteobacteria bacterium]|nr:AsmA family protein [Deltaproteobacteria bacterium]